MQGNFVKVFSVLSSEFTSSNKTKLFQGMCYLIMIKGISRLFLAIELALHMNWTLHITHLIKELKYVCSIPLRLWPGSSDFWNVISLGRGRTFLSFFGCI